MHGPQQLITFVQAVKHGSFAAAARELGAAPSTLAKEFAISIFADTMRRGLDQGDPHGSPMLKWVHCRCAGRLAGRRGLTIGA